MLRMGTQISLELLKNIHVATVEQQAGRAEQHDLDRAPGACVLVPEALDRLGPADGLLHLVENQDGAVGTGGQARGLPLLGDPLGAAQRRLVGASEADRNLRRLSDLLHQGGLAHLPRPRHDVDESSRFSEPPGQLGRLRPLKGRPSFAHNVEYFYSMR